jgi:hypothetical protein
MNTFQIGDIVAGNNSWLNSMIGYPGIPGVITHVGNYSSVIYLFTISEDIILMNDYIDKVMMDNKEQELKTGDLVELKPKIRAILSISGVGTILQETIITTNDFDGKWKDDTIKAFLVYFPEDDYEYTIPKTCLQLFSPAK